jgi:diguanylate cyclase (GGDEF)-like protein
MSQFTKGLQMLLCELELRGSIYTPPAFGPLMRKAMAEARSEYRRNGAFRGAIEGCGTLLVLLSLDAILGWPIALRLLYIVPIWLVAQRAGRLCGTLMVLVVGTLTTVIDAQVDLIHPGRMLLNLFLRIGVMYGLMRIMEEMEARVRAYSTLATRDPLTGLANRLAFDEFAARCVERSLLTHEPLAMGMVDCDRFKLLNDTYGHDFGDQVLRTLAKCLKKALPPEALVARTGGDEFVVALPGRGSEELKKLLNTALVKFLSQSVLQGKCVGFSFGASAFGVDRKTFKAIMQAADRDMYLRKGNRAVVQHLGIAEWGSDLEYRAAG